MEQNISKRYELRESIAQFCNKYYDTDFTSVDIADCDGCLARTGRLFPGCVDCEIKKVQLAKILIAVHFVMTLYAIFWKNIF